MDVPKPTAPSSSLKPHHLLQQAFSNLQSNCSSFIRTISSPLHLPPFQFSPLLLPDTHLSSLKTHLQSAVSGVQTDAARVINAHFWSSDKSPNWARISPPVVARKEAGNRPEAGAMSNEAIEQRMEGVSVYTMGNSDGEMVLIKNAQSGKSLGLFCFRLEDARDILEEMSSVDPQRLPGSKVVPVPLSKVFQLKVDGVSFRLVPEVSQVLNALKEMEKAGSSTEEFPGVPIFQSQNLTLVSQNKRFLPLFFRKEDLEKSLHRARQTKTFDLPLREGDIEVTVLEDVIKGMEDPLCSGWDNVVFIPPGFDVSTDVSRLDNNQKRVK